MEGTEKDPIAARAALMNNKLILARQFRAAGRGVPPPLSEGVFPWNEVTSPGQPLIFQGSTGTAQIGVNQELALEIVHSKTNDAAWSTASGSKQVDNKSGSVKAFLNGVRVHVLAKSDLTRAQLINLLTDLPQLELVIGSYEAQRGQPTEIAVNLAAVADLAEAPGRGAPGNPTYTDGSTAGALTTQAGYRDVGLVDYGFAEDWVPPEAVHLGRTFRVFLRNGSSALYLGTHDTAGIDLLVTVALDIDIVKLTEKEVEMARGLWTDDCGHGIAPARFDGLGQLAVAPKARRRISKKV